MSLRTCRSAHSGCFTGLQSRSDRHQRCLGSKTICFLLAQSALRGRAWLAQLCLGVILTQRHDGLHTAAELLVPPGQCSAKPESPAHRHVGHRGTTRCCLLMRTACPGSCEGSLESQTARESVEVRGGRWKAGGGQAEASSERGGKRVGKPKGRRLGMQPP